MRPRTAGSRGKGRYPAAGRRRTGRRASLRSPTSAASRSAVFAAAPVAQGDRARRSTRPLAVGARSEALDNGRVRRRVRKRTRIQELPSFLRPLLFRGAGHADLDLDGVLSVDLLEAALVDLYRLAIEGHASRLQRDHARPVAASVREKVPR